MTNPIRVLVADDNSLIRRGIQFILDSVDDIEFVGEAEDGQEAVNLLESLKPDIVVMDISMPRLDGLEATEQIQARNTTTQVLILSIHASPTFVRQALSRGARGYILKRTLSKDLLPALYRVNQGELYFSQAVEAFRP
jgi:two-component system response regulator NreC